MMSDLNDFNLNDAPKASTVSVLKNPAKPLLFIEVGESATRIIPVKKLDDVPAYVLLHCQLVQERFPDDLQALAMQLSAGDLDNIGVEVERNRQIGMEKPILTAVKTILERKNISHYDQRAYQ